MCARREKTAMQLRRKRVLAVEHLETRNLMATFASISEIDSTKLLIEPRIKTPPRVTVSQVGSDVVVEMGGEKARFTASGIKIIEFRGSKLDDYFRNDTTINCIAFGEGGTDTLIGGGGSDRLYGRPVKARIDVWGRPTDNLPDTGSNYLWGNGGNDDLYGGSFKDRLDGGDGEDSLWGAEGDDDLFGGKHDDFLYGDMACAYNILTPTVGGKDTLDGGPDNDVLDGGMGDDMLIGRGGNDAFYYSHGQNLPMNLGSDTISGGAGDGIDSIKFYFTPAITIDLENITKQTVIPGLLQLTITSNQAVENVMGTKFDDVIRGNSLNNEFWSGSGNDTLEGRGGDDTLHGEKGGDTYQFRGSKLGRDRIDDDHEKDLFNTLDFRNLVGGKDGIVIDLNDQTVQDVALGHLQLSLKDRDGKLTDIHKVQGSTYHDQIFGNDLENELYGNGGNDLIYGRGGKDKLYGGIGNDGLYGGLGIDTLDGGADKDRLLTDIQDKPGTIETADAHIQFANGAREWKPEDIEKIDTMFNMLHDKNKNTRLLKRHDNKSLTFVRGGDMGKTTGDHGNKSGSVTLYDAAFLTDPLLHETVIHELAHNWDSSDEWVSQTGINLNKEFRTISGWVQSNTPLAGYTKGLETRGTPWYYKNGTTFAFGTTRYKGNEANTYARTSLGEDIADTWKAYFFGKPEDKTHIDAKIKVIDRFMAAIGKLS